MIVASGTSSRHTSSIAEKLIKNINTAEPSGVSSVEGMDEGNWVLVDTGDIIVHIFKPETREMYNLEKMWDMPLPKEAELTVVA